MSERWAAGAWTGPTRVKARKISATDWPRQVSKMQNKKKMPNRWAAGAWTGPTRVKARKMSTIDRPRRVFEVQNKKK